MQYLAVLVTYAVRPAIKILIPNYSFKILMVPYANIIVSTYIYRKASKYKLKYKTESPLAKEVKLVNAVTFLKDILRKGCYLAWICGMDTYVIFSFIFINNNWF